MELFSDINTLQNHNQEISAKAAVSLFYSLIKQKAEDISYRELIDIKNIILEKEPNNIILKNTLNYFLYNLHKTEIKKQADEKYETIIKKIEQSTKEASVNTLKKIKSSAKIFVHSINNPLTNAFLFSNAKAVVNLLEHKPHGELFSNRVKEKKHKINLFKDIEIKDALHNVDLCFIGAEAILKNTETAAKKGAYVVSEMAKKSKIPLYVITTALNYHNDEKLNAQNIEHIPKENITAYICEYGIFRPDHIKEELFFHNKWMFI